MALLDIRNLHLEFPRREGATKILHGIDLSVERGQIVGIVGETGSGKSMTGLAIAGLLPPNARIRAGSIRFDGTEMLGLSEAELRRYRGQRIGMVFQDPSSNLNPVFRIREQMIDVALQAGRWDAAKLGVAPNASSRIRRRAALDLSIAMLERVAIPDAASRIGDYPHQFSGGMRQRVLIAMALIGRPDLLIADEPTTALDVSVQAQVLRLLYDLVKEFRFGVLLITHNMGVVAQLCSEVAVMSQGRIVEFGPTTDVLLTPKAPYTQSLLAAVPRLQGAKGEGLGLLRGTEPVA